MNSTFIHKGANGWRAETNFPLQGAFELKLCTRKQSNSGYLVTVSTVHKVEQGDGYKSETHRVYTDYNQAVLTSAPKRITDKVVERQHAEVLADIEQIKADALAHYKDGLT